MASSSLLERLDSFEILYRDIEPRIHSFVDEPDRIGRLRHEAAELDHRFPDAIDRPPLFGLLLGVKDIFQADGFPTQAGSRLPASELGGREAESVSQLKAAGMLVAGKTVTTEFAYFAPGPTRNPHNVEHTPGGSSSGSAAAVAAGLVDIALGTQTIGSIIRPASYCGVVGFKPSYGRISANGVIPLAPSLDHVGLFARVIATVTQAAQILCTDWKAEGTSRKPRIAIPTGSYLDHVDTEMRVHFEATVDRLSAAGYKVIEATAFSNFSEIVNRHQLILAAEAAHVHASRYEKYADLYHEKTRSLIEKGLRISDEALKAGLDESADLRRHLGTFMQDRKIDLWLSPAATGAAPRGLDSTGDPVMNLPWTQAGYPALGLPSGSNSQDLPLGLQLTANYRGDENLLAWGAEIEGVLEI